MNDLHLDFRPKGRAKFQVVESPRLLLVRRLACDNLHISSKFKVKHKRNFSGGFEDYKLLTQNQRDLIDKEVVSDIILNPLIWQNQRAEAARVAVDSEFSPNLVLTSGVDHFFNPGTSYNPAQLTYYAAVGTGTTPPTIADVGLVAEVKRTGAFLPGVGNCGTTYGTYTTTFRRTYDFSVETVSRNYTELGFAPATSGNLFSRLLISGGSVTVGIGQSLRVVYDITFTVNPSVGSGNVDMGTLWGSVPATWSLAQVTIGDVTTAGTPNSADGLFKPSNGYVGVKAVSGDFTYGYGLATSGSTNVSAEAAGTWGTYTPGSGTRTMTFGIWSAAAFTSSVIRGFVYGRYDQYGFSAFAIKFDSVQSKTNLMRLQAPALTVTMTL